MFRFQMRRTDRPPLLSRNRTPLHIRNSGTAPLARLLQNRPSSHAALPICLPSRTSLDTWIITTQTIASVFA